MCVIVVKEEGVSLKKNKNELRKCFLYNDDGAGFVVKKKDNDDLLLIRKGFFSFDKFWKAVKENIADEDKAILHFRIGTDGSISAGNCHPFPLTKDIDEMKKLKYFTDKIVMAHNGIISIDIEKELDISDTMQFVKDIMADEVIYENMLDPSVVFLVKSMIGTSRLAFIDKEGTITIFGNFIRHENLYYSNNSFEKTRWIYGTRHYNKNKKNKKYENYYYSKPEKNEKYKIHIICDHCLKMRNARWNSTDCTYICQECDKKYLEVVN